MKIEKLRRINKSKIVVGGLISLGVIGAITILPIFAKYKVTQIAHGTANYDVIKDNTVAMYTSEDGENYTEITDRMPDSRYIINEEKSYCNLNGSEDTNVVLKTVDGNHVISNLIKGDKCYLYFDKKTTETVNTALGPIEVQLATPDFSKTAPNDIEGIFVAEDGMYGDYSYYWRGAVTNNYIKFANFCWRIIRINGDGSIRLIYDGTTCHANGTTGEVAVANQAYNTSYNRSEYVGYTYASGSQRGDSSASNLKTQTESWFNTNIIGTNANKVATGKFCNDREVESGETWSSQPSSTLYYAAYGRLGSAKKPTLSCADSSDVYSLKVGAITVDEIAFAGGVFGTGNSSYYLYNGQHYWAMSPSRWNWSNRNAQVFFVLNNGQISNTYVNNTIGIRPVINLLSDTQFKSGTNGTLNNPYEVL